MDDIEKVIASWDEYFKNRVRRRRDITDSYVRYVAKLLDSGLPPILDLHHLARLIGVDTFLLAKLITNQKHYYRTFEIPKRRGGVREIQVPSPALLEVQRWILTNIVENADVHPSAHGFVKNRSIVTNASVHLGQPMILKVDLMDFFPSISLRRGLSVFLHMGYPPNVSYFLAALCFRGERLPQGAATSPALSNIIAKRLDARLAGWAEKHNLLYSRYADDLVFSGSNLKAEFLDVVTGIINAEGFRVNHSKTQFIGPSSKKIIAGVSISNGKLALPRKTVRAIKQQAHFILKRGYWAHIEATGARDPILIERLLGKLSFWLQIDPDNRTAIRLKDLLGTYDAMAE